MKQRTLLMIAAGLTAFVLVLAGGLAAVLGRGAATAATAATVAPAIDPTVEALIKQREAAYQEALAEANARLDQANAQLAQAQATPAAPVQPAQGQPAPAVATPLTAETAAQVATIYRGGGEVQEVDVEQERGLTVYEVQFTDGAEVYVEAGTGQVVYARLAGEGQGLEAQEREGHEGREHERGNDD